MTLLHTWKEFMFPTGLECSHYSTHSQVDIFTEHFATGCPV